MRIFYTSIFSVSLLFSNVSFAAKSDSENFQTCLNNLSKKSKQNGLTREEFKKLTYGIKPNMSLVKNLVVKNQPEFKYSLSDYVNRLVTKERIEKGKTLYVENQVLLEKIEDKYGVPGNVVIAVWAVESNYGQNIGKLPILDSLATLSCNGRRKEFFTKEFFSALRIVKERNFKVSEFKGSWAGAFGHTQFMPTTFERIAVDFNNDGKRDLINNIPDALASTANFLIKAGWNKNMTWGIEVEIPPNFKIENQGRKNKKPISYWKEKGVKLKNGIDLPSNFPESGLILENELIGNKFLVTSNFDAIYRYNAAESYALAISKLSEIIKENVFILEENKIIEDKTTIQFEK